MMRFEVLVSEQFVVLKNGVGSLWWKRNQQPSGGGEGATIDTRSATSKPEFRLIKDNDKACWDEFTCHGLAYGLVGLFQDDKLILIKQNTSVGRLPFGSQEEVFKIQKICVVPLQSKGDPLEYLGLDKCSQDSCSKPLVIIPSPNEPYISASFKDSIIEEASLKIHPGNNNGGGGGGGGSTSGMQKTWNQIKLTASNVKPQVRNKLNLMSSSSSSTGGNGQPSRIDDKEKIERRFIEELYKMFNETNSFYYSWRGDLTNSVQRQFKLKASTKAKDEGKESLVPLWKRVDERFFWNHYMLRPVINLFEDSMTTEDGGNIEDIYSHSHTWVLPIIQGFVQIEKCYFDSTDLSPIGSSQKDQVPASSGVPGTAGAILEERDYYVMTLISRRSHYRAGTRYKKRGLDENGKCANYVETEQIFTYGTHTVSFVCVRGSVPLFWSQVGHKYRPPPRLERSEVENSQAFGRHFEEEFNIYGDNVVAINLIERTGREKILSDAFLDYVIRYDNARLTFVSFDFHDHCRGMRFENVSILMDRIYEMVKERRYTWLVNDEEMVCEQDGVFRINCVDCLDRTNIVMTAVAKAVMDIQLVRLSLLPPEGQLPANSRRIFQLMWAHNGDIISRQYAGTAALKGDYTRTGERKISGVMRDGYNSANRYYLNRFRDAYRQAIIDIMQGNPVSESLISPESEKSKTSLLAPAASLPTSSSSSSLSSSDQEYHERIKLVIEDCKKILVPEEEVILGGWPLVDADPVTGTSLSSARIVGELVEVEMDIVLILTKDCYYVADYDDQTDRIVKYQKVLLEDLEKIELGAEPNWSNVPFGSIRGSQNNRVVSYAARFHYIIDGQSGYFHMFRSTSTRFFNNMAIPIRTREEALESLKAICESFRVALSVKSLNVPFLEVGRLERRKSKRLYSGSFKFDNSNSCGKSANFGGGAGGPNSNKILNGVYSHLSKLRGKLAGGFGGTLMESKVPSLPESGQEEYEATTPTGANEEQEDDDEESDEDDSLLKLRKRRFNRSLPLTTSNSSSSSLVVERTLSSDMSDGSDFDDSELMLPPISELGSPADESGLGGPKENMDRVLESCGILVTSPPLRQTPPSFDVDVGGGRTSRSMLEPRPSNPSPTSSAGGAGKAKSVLHDVDDFVIDSMKKASLRQIHRKAASQISLSASNTSIANQENPKIQIDRSDRGASTAMDTIGHEARGSSARCIFSSELALNSIVSQSIKRDADKLSGSLSTDALDTSGTSAGEMGTSKPNEQANLAFQCGGAYPLLSSSSFAALSYQDDMDMASFDNQSMSLNILPEDYLSLGGGQHNLGVCPKESSLSVSNLYGGHANLKTSLSSNALQTSGQLSLNLPVVNSASVLMIADEVEGSSGGGGGHIPMSSSGSNFTSSLMVKKDLVFSPLSRIARGMQNLTLNLRSSGGTDVSNDPATAALIAELQKRQEQTKSRIVII